MIRLSYDLDVGARNHRHLCAVHYSKTPGFEVAKYCIGRQYGLVHIGSFTYAKRGNEFWYMVTNNHN